MRLLRASALRRRDRGLDATTVRRLVVEMDSFPVLGKQVQDSIDLAIGGEIFRDAHSAVLRPESEIVLIPKIGGEW